MSSISIAGNTSGSIALSAPDVAGTNTVTLPAQTGTLQTLGVGTSVATTSGTSITFTGIPSWAKRITVMLQGVSTNGTSSIQIQIGSGSVLTTGYIGSASSVSTVVSSVQNSTGFRIDVATSASDVRSGLCQLINITGNTWAFSGVSGLSNTALSSSAGGYVALSGTLDRVVLTTVNGTDTFDAGSVNIIYEG